MASVGDVIEAEEVEWLYLIAPVVLIVVVIEISWHQLNPTSCQMKITS